MRKRSTIAVEDIKKLCNEKLAIPDNTYVNADFRRGVATILESILMSTGNYRGFGHVDWLNGGYERWEAAGRPDFPEKESFIGEDSKRIYY